MTILRRLSPALAALALAACAAATFVSPPTTPLIGWTSAAAETRPAGLGLPGGARLAQGVSFAGGIEVALREDSPLHSLSDLKLTGGDGFVGVTDAGDLVRGRLRVDARGRLTGLADLRFRRLTLMDGAPIVEKRDGDAEGLAVTDSGDLLISFERTHRIWSYGLALAPRRTPEPVRSPDFDFPLNDGMEGVSAAPGGAWRVAAENGGVWDCLPAACRVVAAPPTPPLADADYRITGMDRDPAGGFFVVQRSYSPPIDARARVRRMAADGTLGPVLIELKLPGTTDNFEGIAAVARNGATRLYILSDDNNSDRQRTLLLAFDVRPSR